MAAYRPKSLDDLNNQYDKVKSAEQAIKQGQTRLGAENAALHGTQRVTWNYDPAKYRVSKEEAAALTGSVDRFIKEFSTREKPQASALELARQALETGEQAQPELQPETAAAFDALLARAKAETSRAVEQAQQSVAEEHRAAVPIDPIAGESQGAEGGVHHGVYQSAQAPVKEGELSGLMDEYMRVMNDEDADEHGRRFRRRRKDRKRAKEADMDAAARPPVVPFSAAPESEMPQDFLAPEESFVIPEEVVDPVKDEFDVPEEVVAPVEDAFDVPEEVVAPVEDEFDIPEEVVAPVEDAFDVPDEVVAPVEDAFDAPEEVVDPVEDEFDVPEEVVAPVEDAFDVPEEVVAPVKDAFDAPEEVVEPVEDAFDAPEEVVEPVEDAFDVPEEVVVPVEDEFDVPEEVVTPVEDAFDVPEEVVEPVEDAFDVPEEVVTPVEDAFDVPEEVVEPVEDEFDVPEEVVTPVEDAFDVPEEVVEPVEDEFDVPEEVVESVEDAYDAPASDVIPAEEAEETVWEEAAAPAEEAVQAPEEDDFVFPEEFLMPVFEPEAPASDAPEDPVLEAPEQAAVEEPFQEAVDAAFPEPLDEPEQEVVIPVEEELPAADENGEEPDVFPEPQTFDDLPEDAQTDDYVPQFAAPAETDELLGEEAAYPAQFEDVMSYSGDADPEDRFVPAEEQPQETAEADEAPLITPEPTLDPQPEAPEEQAPPKKEHRFLRGIGKFFCSIFLIVSLLATVCVALLGTVLGINSGKPTIGDYYLFTASNTYEGTAVDEGDLVLCQQTSAIPNDAGVVYIDAQSHSFSFGVKRSDRVDSAQNTMVYDISGVSVTKENLLGTVVQTLPKVGVYVRYIIDHFVPLLCGCAALDVLWILLLVLLSHRRRDAEEALEPAFVPENAVQDDLDSDIN